MIILVYFGGPWVKEIIGSDGLVYFWKPARGGWLSADGERVSWPTVKLAYREGWFLLCRKWRRSCARLMETWAA